MLFSSTTFIFMFLTLLLILYFPIKNIKYRNIILLIFSLIFYSWGEPKYIFLMLLTVLIAYIFGLLIDKYRKDYINYQDYIIILRGSALSASFQDLEESLIFLLKKEKPHEQ